MLAREEGSTRTEVADALTAAASTAAGGGFRGSGKPVDLRTTYIQNEYGNRILARDSQEAIGEIVSSEQSDNNIFLEVVRGVNKKKRIPSLGHVGENYLPSSKRSTGISESEILQLKSEHMEMKTVCSNLTAENQSLKEQLSGLYVTQEKMLKFMETFSQSHPHPPPPPPANEDGQQFDDEYDVELDG